MSRRLPLSRMARPAKGRPAHLEPSVPTLDQARTAASSEAQLPAEATAGIDSPGGFKAPAGLRGSRPESKPVFLPPGWPPLALIPRDALIAGAAVLLGHWYPHHPHPIPHPGG